ncbi:N-acetyl-1-D-myo-inositol-2-amino-2-deoxy-alpha-D-glucopyranoside deacetylase [Corynebacterium auriscanis]|uniref:N-acetyl-1-D-myo-inositol-2-amino-2-deoxy-alpha- D-glucopyranoside deacetylase n=1 Tax=Corynebacterium auriscanis TaxID=99807 RepID=UPI003CE9FA20
MPNGIMAVHAHPDDESIWTGLALAKARRLGHEVTNVTCTLGEEGEVIGEKYARLVENSQHPEGTGMLGGYRIAELQRALEALGIDHGPLLLGGAGCWRDSGMAGTPSIEHSRAFAATGRPDDFVAQVAQLVDLIRARRPSLIITYDSDGGYGHPDHIRAHQITRAAVEQLRGTQWEPQQVLWAVTDRAKVMAALESVEAPEGWTMATEADVAGVDSLVNPDAVDFVVSGSAEDVASKQKAMAAHATQVWVADGTRTDVNSEARYSEPVVYCLSNMLTLPLLNEESYAVGYTAEEAAPDFSARLFAGDSATE